MQSDGWGDHDTAAPQPETKKDKLKNKCAAQICAEVLRSRAATKSERADKPFEG